jgi:hypothetical protein
LKRPTEKSQLAEQRADKQRQDKNAAERGHDHPSNPGDIAPKFYPAVSSLLAPGLPCSAVGATGAGVEMARPSMMVDFRKDADPRVVLNVELIAPPLR